MADVSHGGGDVSSTLGELERKLKELERELQSAGGEHAASAPHAVVPPTLTAVPFDRPPVAPTPAPTPTPTFSAPPPPAPAPPPTPSPAPAVEPTPDLVAEARASIGGLQGQLAELHRFREQLERSARELMDEYTRVLGALGAPPAAPAPPQVAPPAPAPAPPAPAPAPAAVAPPQPAPPAVHAPIGGGVDAPVPAAQPPAALAGGLPPSFLQQPTPPPPGAETPGQPTAAAEPWPAQDQDEAFVSGQVTVDAGPFGDIATLSAFEQALGRVPGAQDVYVRGFEGNRALIDVQLGSPVLLGEALRATAGLAFRLVQSGPGRVQVTIDAA